MNKTDTEELRTELAQNLFLNAFDYCYVKQGKKSKTSGCRFSDMSQDESERIVKLFIKALSGTIGKHQCNVVFAQTEQAKNIRNHLLSVIGNVEDTSTTHSRLDQIYDWIIDNYMPKFIGENPEDYMILIGTGTYDMPSRSKEGRRLKRRAGILNLMHCIICPVVDKGTSLRYESTEEQLSIRIDDFLVSNPELGFFFPSYNRGDVSSEQALCYSRNAKDFQPTMMENAFGCIMPLTAIEQLEIFVNIMNSIQAAPLEVERITAFKTSLAKYHESDDPDMNHDTIDCSGMKTVLKDAQFPDSFIEAFEYQYAHMNKNRRFSVPALLGSGAVNINSKAYVFKAKAGSRPPRTVVIDGVRMIAFPVEDDCVSDGIAIG